ncbi:MAG: PTS sugar transporter subunit IIC [Solobacterium sp.]|nr:PTS sugar transporter subunit IIC [Solobacterium sp.]
MKNESISLWIQEKLIPAIAKFTSFKFVKCMQEGVVACMNATMIGSIFMLLMIPPFPATATGGFVEAWRAFSAANAGWLNMGYQIGLNAAGFYILLGMVNAVCKHDNAPLVNNMVLAVFSYICLQCSFLEGGGLDIGFWGAKGMMAALIVGYFVPQLNIWLKKNGIKIRMPDSVPPFISNQLEEMFSSVGTVIVVFAVKLLFAHFGTTLGAFVNSLFAPLFSASDSLTAVLIYCILVRILWFFGLHGNNIAGAVVNVVLAQNFVANAEAVAAGGKPTFIFNTAFQNWTTQGILFIVIAVILVAKSEQLKAVSKVSLAPALFNIGEPTTFGLPLILNFDIFIPYLIVFALNGAIPYLACKFGFMNIPYIDVPFTVPAFIKVFLQTMDFRAIIVYLINAAACILIMIPAIKKYDAKLLAQEQADANQ